MPSVRQQRLYLGFPRLLSCGVGDTICGETALPQGEFNVCRFAPWPRDKNPVPYTPRCAVPSLLR